MVLRYLAVSPVFYHFLICVEYGGETCVHYVTLVDDAFALLDYPYRSHGFLVGLLYETFGVDGVEIYVGLQHVGEAGGGQGGPDIAVAQCAVEVFVGAECRQIAVGGHGYRHVVVHESH